MTKNRQKRRKIVKNDEKWTISPCESHLKIGPKIKPALIFVHFGRFGPLLANPFTKNVTEKKVLFSYIPYMKWDFPAYPVTFWVKKKTAKVAWEGVQF